MVWNPPFGISAPQGGSYPYTAGDFRRWQSALLAHGTDTISALPGVLYGLEVSLSGSNVLLSRGSAVFSPTGTNDGSYLGVNSESGQVATLDAADQLYERRDRLVAVVQDPDTTGGSDRGVATQYLVGTPNEAAPPVPDGAQRLAQLVVPAGSGTPSVIDERTYTGVLGGTIPCQSTDRPDVLAMRPGQTIFETDTGLSFVWSGSDWRPLGGGAVELGAGVDLDTITAPGVYSQTSRSEADSGLNYPPKSAVLGTVTSEGILEVVASDTGYAVTQRYTESNSGGVVWQRSKLAGTWAAWYPLGGGLEDWTLAPVSAASGVSGLSAIPGSAQRGVNRRGAIAIQFDYTGPTITAGSTGNFGDRVLMTITDSTYCPPRDTDVMIVQSGVASYFGRINSTGDVVLTHANFPGQEFAAATYRINQSWGPS